MAWRQRRKNRPMPPPPPERDGNDPNRCSCYPEKTGEGNCQQCGGSGCRNCQWKGKVEYHRRIPDPNCPIHQGK